MPVGQRLVAITALVAAATLSVIAVALPGRTPQATARAPGVAITGRTFYVSPSGSDSGSGRSPDRAWKTVDQVNRAHLEPGDGVLFQGGATFSDDTLMPGWGTDVSGSSGSPVVFGSYGPGNAILPKGVWTKGESYLVFERLDLGPAEGVSGTGEHIIVQNCSIKNMTGSIKFAIDTVGSYYTIRNDTIDRTGDSGMLLRGDHYLVQSNTIANTGLDPAVTWGAHGIYLKASDSTVTGNTITNFHNEGVSVRYRNSTLTGNAISGGQIGIAWFQYDPEAGTSRWSANTITSTTLAGIYVSPHDIAGQTRESFVIADNRIRPVAGVHMDLAPSNRRHASQRRRAGRPSIG